MKKYFLEIVERALYRIIWFVIRNVSTKSISYCIFKTVFLVTPCKQIVRNAITMILTQSSEVLLLFVHLSALDLFFTVFKNY